MCPTCDHVQIINPANRVAKLEKEVSQLRHELGTTLSMVDSEEIINYLLFMREKVRKMFSTEYFDQNYLKRWLAITSLISSYPWVYTNRVNLILLLLKC
jgi:hypothetical protein